MRYLLCGPISGMEDYNEPAFAEAAERLRRVGMFVLNPLEISRDRSLPWGYYMALSTEAILYGDVDGLILLPGWLDSLGARIEYGIAKEMGLTCTEYAVIRENI